MAIKFFKVLGGLTKLFKKPDKSSDQTTTTQVNSSNYTDVAINNGVTDKSIVQITATEQDAWQFGGHYLPGTQVLYVDGKPHIDSSNVLYGISMQIYNNKLVFIAPMGMLKETDKVKIGRIKKTSAKSAEGEQFGKGTLGITVWDSPTNSFSIQKYSWAQTGYMEKWEVNYGSEGLENLPINLTNKKIAFSIWRNDVQVSDWFPWYLDSKGFFHAEKGTYYGPIQINYSDLVKLKYTGKLSAGRTYCILDYKPASIKSDLVYSGATNNGLYVRALTRRELSEDGILIYGDQQCEVKYGLTKNRWSTNQYTVQPSVQSLNDKGNFAENLDGTGYQYELIWTRDTQILSQSKYKAIRQLIANWCSQDEKNILYFRSTITDKSSPLNGTRLIGGIEVGTFYESSPVLIMCVLDYEETESGIDETELGPIEIEIPDSEQIPTSYTGEVYWMRDPNGNEATYDFKGYKLKDGKETLWTFNANDNSDGSSNGECTNNRILYDGYYNILSPEIHNLVLNTHYSTKIIHQTSSDQFGNQIITDGYRTPSGTSSQFLMANGSTLNGIGAKATKLTADKNPTVSFSDGTFTFGIPSGTNGQPGATGTRGNKWYSGTAITGTSTTATKFTSSGITDALAGDKYYNTSTCNIYECVTGGTAANATWKYIGNIKGATGAKGDKGDTGSVASLTQTDGTVVTGVSLDSDKKLSVTRGNIGGRNLLLNSRTHQFLQWSGEIDKYEAKDEYYQITSAGTGDKAVGFYYNASQDLTTKELKGNYITVSGFVRTDVDDSIKIGILFQKEVANTTVMGSYYTTAQYLKVNANEWTRIYSTFKCDHNLDESFMAADKSTYKINAACIVICSTQSHCTIKTVYQVKQLKLEFGSVPTDWSVAPEEGDLYNRSDNPTITVGGIGPSTNLQNKTMKEMFDLLLYPYVKFSVSASVSPSVYEYNTQPTLTYTATITNGSETIQSTTWSDGTNGTECQFKATTNQTGNIARTVTVIDSHPTTLTATATAYPGRKIYYGFSATAITTSDQVKTKLGGVNTLKTNPSGALTVSNPSTKQTLYLLIPTVWWNSYKLTSKLGEFTPANSATVNYKGTNDYTIVTCGSYAEDPGLSLISR